MRDIQLVSRRVSRRLPAFFIVLIALIITTVTQAEPTTDHATIAAGFDNNSRPLPLAANWNCRTKDGFSPEWQIEQMKQGHHLLFTIRLDAKSKDKTWAERNEPIFQFLRERNAPICLRWGNWVDQSMDDPSPFDPIDKWQQAGEAWIRRHSAQLDAIVSWYPQPPYVVMLANNEDKLPNDAKIIKSAEYIKIHGSDKDDAYHQRAVGEAWLERFNALFNGMRAGSGSWGERMRFIGYAWGGEANINAYNMNDSPLAWDGVSARAYLDRNLTDFKTYSVTVTAMNLRLKKAWYLSQKPDAHFEVSTWWRKREGIPPHRYRAMVIWNLWMARPHSIRQFTSWGTKADDDLLWYQQVLQAVDQIHENETLKTFWQQADPVVNQNIEIGVHVIDKPPREGTWKQGRLIGFVDDAKMDELAAMSHAYYALKTSVDPTELQPLGEERDGRSKFPKDAEFRVWAQAQVMGKAPARRWLVFAYAPRGNEEAVTISIPGYGDIAMDVPEQGIFAVIDEVNRSVSYIPVEPTPARHSTKQPEQNTRGQNKERKPPKQPKDEVETLLNDLIP